MDGSTNVTDHLIAKFASRVSLSDVDRAAVAAMPFKLRTVNASAYLLREGQHPTRCAFLIDGMAYRQKLTPGGEREIVAILVPGDFCDLQHLFLEESDHDVLALTRSEIAEIAVGDLRELALNSPAIGRAMWIDVLIEASIQREWLLNIGRRDARARIAHLLCEFQVRLHVAVGEEQGTYELPMTQEQLGDALGLTPVHVNRVLKTLEQEGLISRRKRQIGVADWPQLRHAADFNERYLHLNQTIG